MLGFILIVLGVVFLECTRRNRSYEELRFLGFTLGFILIVASCYISASAYTNQLVNWSQYKVYEQKIKYAEETRNTLTERLNNINVNTSSFMNADSPVNSIVSSLNNIEISILNIKLYREDRVSEIIAGERGVNGFWRKLARPSYINDDWFKNYGK